jgi:acyl-CoA reductase-like NAD-dependent aldehyde dehydrogenase
VTNVTTCINPATGETIGSSPLDNAEDVRTLVEKARAAQKLWASFPYRKKAAAILRIRDAIVAEADPIADIISKNNGKTRTDAMATEVFPAAAAATYYAKTAKRFLRPRSLSPGLLMLANKRAHIARVPYGVIGIISPWNYPFSIPFSEVVMGLLAGNAVILKTASQTQLIGRALERVVLAGGLPKDLFAYVNLPGRLAGPALLGAGIDKLFFTGSVPIGKTLMAKAAETLTPVVLELGGNDPMIVCKDADLVRAAKGAVWAGMQNAGQSCGGVERIYVHRDVCDPFLELLAAEVRALRVGPDNAFDVDMGAMTSEDQLKIVREHMQEATSKGAVIFAQSECPKNTKGTFLPAMVVTNVDHTMRLMREETFGPVVGVMKFATEEEAIRLANDSDLGLTGSVWSKNRGEAERIARQIQAGVVTVNDHLMSHGLAETPWGGFKQSGIGRTHGDIGFSEMTQPQCIVHDYLPFVKRNMWWYPHNESIYAGIRGLLHFMYSPSLFSKIGGLLKLLKIFPRTFFA